MRRAAVIGLMMALGWATLALGQKPGNTATSDRWELTLAPYLILPWISGHMSVKGNDVTFDAGPDTIIDNLQFAGMGYFGARRGNWGVAVDVLFIALGTTLERPPANVDPEEGAFTFMGTRKIHPQLDFVFGARWNYLNGRIEFKGPLQTVVEDTKNWVDPIVGIQFRQPLGKRWHFVFQGDIGGFGAGSDFTWNVFPSISVDVAKRVRLGFGYRAISLEYITGEGFERFEYDATVSGPAFGLSFHF